MVARVAAAGWPSERETEMFCTTRRRTAIGIVLGLVVSALWAAGGEAATPATMTQQEYAALMARSEALDQQYGLGRYAVSSRDEALNARYGNAWTRLSPAEFKTIVDLFGAEATTMPLEQLQASVARGLALERQAGTARATRVNRSGGFDWGDSGIGAAATFGVALLALAVVIALRRRGGPVELAGPVSH
jgi:hypothetical protein